MTFTAGIVGQGDGTASLHTGLNDCQIGKLEIADPLLESEAIAL